MAIPTVLVIGDETIVTAVRESLDRYQCHIVPMPRVAMWSSMIPTMTEHDVTVVDSRIVSPAEIGHLVRTAHAHRHGMLVIGTVDAAVMEEIRHLGVPVIDRSAMGTAMEHLARDRRWREQVSRTPVVIAVGTAKGGVGKSFLALNIAEGFTGLGARVLLVDADISNASLAVIRRLPPTTIPYLRIVEQSDSIGFTDDRLRACLTTVPVGDTASMDVVVPSDPREPTASDFSGRSIVGWEGFQRALIRLAAAEGIDVVVVDVGPDIKRRPYPLTIVANTPAGKGWCLIPALPGRLEVQATVTMLSYLARIPIEGEQPGMTGLQRSLIVPVSAERGFLYTHDQTLYPTLAAHWPGVATVGTNTTGRPVIIPRAPDLVSYLESDPSRYDPPTVEFPYHPFSQAIFTAVQSIAHTVGITLPRAAPVPSWWERMKIRIRGATNRQGVPIRTVVTQGGHG